MIWAALAILLAAAPGDTSPREGGAAVAGARVSAQVVQPAVVRQATGLEPGADAPRAQTRPRDGRVLIEFE